MLNRVDGTLIIHLYQLQLTSNHAKNSNDGDDVKQLKSEGSPASGAVSGLMEG